jgi:hypothetical protein
VKATADLAQPLRHAFATMDANHTTRRGRTPIVQSSGQDLTYLLWIQRGSQPCDLLVIRRCADGSLLVSLQGDPETCKGDIVL